MAFFFQCDILENVKAFILVPFINLRLGHALLWRHNGRGSVSNHQHHDCLLKRLYRRRSKKTSKLRVTGLCAGNSPGAGEFPAQMVSNKENVSIWWRHHGFLWDVIAIPCYKLGDYLALHCWIYDTDNQLHLIVCVDITYPYLNHCWFR